MTGASPRIEGSIRRRLVILLLLGAAAMAIGLYFVVQSVARQMAQEAQDNILAASANAILESAAVRQGELTIDLPYSALSMLGNVTDERAFYAVRLGPEFLTGYDDLPLPDVAAAGSTGFLTADFLGEEVRIAAARRPISTRLGAENLTVAVAQTREGQRQVLGRISRLSLGIGAGFFLLAACLALVVAASTTRPLRRLTGALSRRGPDDLRPVSGPVPAEMAPLVASLNTLMRRLGTALVRSEEFIAEAAHRIRTPLAIVRTQAEITQRRVEKPENREAVREMIRAIDESTRTAGQLLDHAMVIFRADRLEDGLVDLPALVRDGVERLRPLSEMREVEMRTEIADEVSVRGDPILLQNALANLFDNAIKYASGAGSVTARVRRDGDRAIVEICDDGPGFPEASEGALTGRFVRGDNAAEIVGSGLGLTIAEEVTRAHGGTLTLSNRPGGGACVSLSFPSA